MFGALGSRVRVGLIGLLALAGCDPPCEPYWKLACERCDDAGCRIAKERAAGLKDGAACEADRQALQALLEQGSKDIACTIPVKGKLPPPAMFGAYTCRAERDGEPFPLSIGARAITAGPKQSSQSFTIVQMTADWLNVKVTSSMQTTCKLASRGDDLGFDCATPLGTLGARLSCVRKAEQGASDGSDPKTCAGDDEGKTRCSADGQRVLACRAGAVVVEQWCRGPKGCAPSGDFTSCDESVARAGDPCTDSLGMSAPKTEDGSGVLACVGGKWQLNRAASSASPSAR